MFYLSRLWVGTDNRGAMWSMECVSGVERAFSTEVSGAPQRIRGVGSLALWPMIKPVGHAAGVKRVELHPSGSWCNDIRNVEISVLV